MKNKLKYALPVALVALTSVGARAEGFDLTATGTTLAASATAAGLAGLVVFAVLMTIRVSKKGFRAAVS